MLMACDRLNARSRAEVSGIPIRLSIYECGACEALRHKWIESEKAGYDLGDWAIHHWIKRYWNAFLRERWIEHLEGRIFWTELDQGDFGLLQCEFLNSKVRDEIIRRIKSGGENLDILCWYLERKHSREELREVLHILERLDINNHRLEYRLEAGRSQAGCTCRDRTAPEHRPAVAGAGGSSWLADLGRGGDIHCGRGCGQCRGDAEDLLVAQGRDRRAKRSV
jgi:hypothetical protein